VRSSFLPTPELCRHIHEKRINAGERITPMPWRGRPTARGATAPRARRAPPGAAAAAAPPGRTAPPPPPRRRPLTPPVHQQLPQPSSCQLRCYLLM